MVGLEPIGRFNAARLQNWGERMNYPASASQERLWSAQELAPDTPAFNQSASARLRGHLDLPALQRSLDLLTQRHQALRTSFELDAGRLRQVVALCLEARLRVLDLRSRPPAEQQRDLERAIEAEIARPFDLGQPPLLRATVARLDESDQALALVTHNIVADDWSLKILASELAALYAESTANTPSLLPPLTVQFGDYAVWEQEEQERGGWRKQLGYWRKQLSGSLPFLRLAPGRLQPVRKSFRGATRRMQLSPQLSEGLKDLCRRERVTPFMLLLTAFMVLLHRYTGQTDLVVGAPAATRRREELEHLIGCFINLLAVRSDASGNPTLREFLRRVREVVLAALCNAEVPFERVLEELQLRHRLEPAPLLQALFTFDRGPLLLRLPGLQSQLIQLGRSTARFDLLMEWWEAGPRLEGRLEYSTDLFEAETMARMAAHYRLLLETLAANPERRLSEMAGVLAAAL